MPSKTELSEGDRLYIAVAFLLGAPVCKGGGTKAPKKLWFAQRFAQLVFPHSANLRGPIPSEEQKNR